MKKLTFFLLFVISVNHVAAQNQYYDALALKKSIKDGVLTLDTTVIAVLNQYYPTNELSDATDVTNAFRSNPFLSLFEIKGKAEGDGEKIATDIYRSGLSSLGNLDVTNFSKGLSLFLIDRAREELNVAFFSKFKREFEKNMEYQILFPATSDKIVSLLEYQYNEMLPILQKAFVKDMEVLPYNLVELLHSDKYYVTIKDFPEFILIVESFNIIRQIDQFSPPELIDNLPEMVRFGNKKELDNYMNVFKLSRILSNSVRSSADDSTKLWIASSQFYNDIIRDSVARTFFLGLIYQQIANESIQFSDSLLYKTIKNNEQQVFWLESQFGKLLKITDQVDESYRHIRSLNKEEKTLAPEDISAYFGALIDVVDFGFSFATHFNKNIRADKYISLGRNANNLYISTIKQEYTLASNSAISIINSISSLKTDGKSLIPVKLMSGINTYGRFISNVADAQSPEEVSIALKSVALSQGSSSMKKYQQGNVASNAYLGAAYRRGKENSSSYSWNNAVGVAAPVGIAWTFASCGSGGSLSLFGSVLDVGAIVDYQLTENNVDFVQKILLKNILSPGAYLVYGSAWNLPLSLGVGGQYGPGLTGIGNQEFNPSWRLNVFLAVDLPIFNIYQGRKKMMLRI